MGVVEIEAQQVALETTPEASGTRPSTGWSAIPERSREP